MAAVVTVAAAVDAVVDAATLWVQVVAVMLWALAVVATLWAPAEAQDAVILQAPAAEADVIT